MEKQKNPAPPEVLVERDRVITRVGNTELIQTKDAIRIQARCKSHPHSS